MTTSEAIDVAETLRRHPDAFSGGARLIPIRPRTARSTSGPSASATTRESRCCCCTAGRAHARVLRGVRQLPAAGRRRVLLLRPAGLGYSDQPDEPELWEIRALRRRGRAGAPGARPGRRQLLPARPLVGRHPGHRVRADAPRQHLKGLVISNMMSSIPAYNALRARGADAGDGSGGAGGDPGASRAARSTRTRATWSSSSRYHTEHILRMPFAEWPDPVHARLRRTSTGRSTSRCRGRARLGASGQAGELGPERPICRRSRRPRWSSAPRTTPWTRSTWRGWRAQLPHGRYLHCPNGSHMAMYDDQAVYMSGLLAFLREVGGEAAD